MDRKSFEKQKAFAGERVPSMKRRCLDRDYSARGIYMVTLVTEGRRKLFGDVAGRSDGQPGSADAPRMELSALGSEVVRCWESIPRFYPEVKPVALQMMPDHLHGILFVTRQMEDSDLGDVIKGFKTGCNKAFRGLAGVGCVGCVATLLQHTGQDAQRHTGHEHGFLFERGYNDRLLLRKGQLQRWIDYLADNPRRLLAKREHPDLFRVRYGHEVAGMTFAALGNRFLLDRPYKLQVQCSRSLTPADIEAAKARYLAEARQGAVLVSPAISEGEKAVMHAALDARLPLIFLSPNSLTPLSKPGGPFIEACSRGDLLILAPWPDRSATQDLTRAECLTMNSMTEKICAL